MEMKQGIGVSPGVAIAGAVVLDAEEFRITRRIVPPEETEYELEWLEEGLVASLAEIRELRESMSQQFGSDIADIFDFHQGVLSKAHLHDQIAALGLVDAVGHIARL